jgi:hypothetical protein
MQNEMTLKIEPHFFTAFAATEVAISVLEILPETDLIEILKNLIYVQHDLFIHIIERKHFGTNNLQDFMDYIQEIKDEVRRLKNAE